MPGTTTNNGYPYPVDADPIDVAGDVRRLAEAIDTGVDGLDTRVAAIESRLPFARYAAIPPAVDIWDGTIQNLATINIPARTFERVGQANASLVGDGTGGDMWFRLIIRFNGNTERQIQTYNILNGTTVAAFVATSFIIPPNTAGAVEICGQKMGGGGYYHIINDPSFSQIDCVTTPG